MKRKIKDDMVNSIVNTLSYYTLKQEKKQKNQRVTRIERSKLNTNSNDGNLVKTNTWNPLLRDISNLENKLWNQRSHYKADLMSN